MLKLRIGRSDDNDIVINDVKVSRYHLSLTLMDDNSVIMEDLGSTNGTYVNKWKINSHVEIHLRPSDQLTIGDTVLPWTSYFSLNPNPSMSGDESGKSPQRYYDMSVDHRVLYGTLRDGIIGLLNDYKSTLNDMRQSPLVNSYSDDMLALLLYNYRQDLDKFLSFMADVSNKSLEIKNQYDTDRVLLDGLKIKVSVAIGESDKLMAISKRRDEIEAMYSKVKDDVEASIIEISRQFEEKHPYVYTNRYDLAPTCSDIWMGSTTQAQLPSKTLYLGCNMLGYNLFDGVVYIQSREYIDFLCQNNIVVKYDKTSAHAAEDFVSSMVARLYHSSPASLVDVSVVDLDELNGLNTPFKRLNRKVYHVIVRNGEVSRYLDEKERYIENIVQNAVLDNISTVYELNQKNETPIPYNIIIFKWFPKGCTSDTLSQLKRIMKNGLRTGVHTIIMADMDELAANENSAKLYAAMGLDDERNRNVVFDFVQNCFANIPKTNLCRMDFDVFTAGKLTEIVHEVNKGFEVVEERVVRLSDYMVDKKDWWSGRSGSYIEIPFGLGENKEVVNLNITQESGQNSAVVIGIPGSGKSVFLHSLILSAAMRYSPDELEMYLIDFSGVEFNTYSLHNLPHAKVIAPEAEREFGLSVLRGLRDEGRRREALCRENDVNSIVELRRCKPDQTLPRRLVIIDEFQKLFENENDYVAREANTIIHIIVQEYRKFGINLVLATQQLPSSSILPVDLIANRVVFRSRPRDFDSLISWPSGTPKPQLSTGECIYNSNSGSPYDNVRAQGFFMSKKDIDTILDQVTAFAQNYTYRNHIEMLSFRVKEQPLFSQIRLHPNHTKLQTCPKEVGVYFGRYIAISDYDTYISLRRENSNNVLIVGGDAQVARNTAICAAMSVMSVHEDNTMAAYVLNFVKDDDVLGEYIENTLLQKPFHESSCMVCNNNDAHDLLTQFSEEVESRKSGENDSTINVYLTIFGFHNSGIFDRGGAYGNKESADSQLLSYIIKNGPSVGVFTILQTDRIESVDRLECGINGFNYRVALQMSEKESNKTIGSVDASKLSSSAKHYTKYRACLFDYKMNSSQKFIPYKLLNDNI